jgi:BRCA1-associated protein
MNVENGRVWDFAGDGYVHRLIIQQSDNIGGEGEGEGEGEEEGGLYSTRVPLSSNKMVEIPDPRYRLSSYRTRQAPLSSNEESILINRKLESTAYHYNQLLTWQLEQNRQQHEDRLSRFKDFLKQELKLRDDTNTNNTNSSNSHSNSNSNSNSKSWSQTIEELLLLEKAKALKKRDVALIRLDDARKELTLLGDLNRSLANNLKELHEVTADAERKVAVATNVYSDYIPKLEKKVASLMEKL